MSLISSISGEIEGAGADYVLLNIGPFTLKIFVPTIDMANLENQNTTVQLHTHLVVREDDLQIYGFITQQGRDHFESLIGISGVGPRVALAVLSVLSPDEVVIAINSGDSATLSKAPGVGKRTAERIIVELKSKIEPSDGVGQLASQLNGNTGTDPALQWLIGLGFSSLEARQALAVETIDGLSVDQRVRRALQRMGKE
jgi:Holliday junction DNA helicase RuvA